jgi:hypothetical protein
MTDEELVCRYISEIHDATLDIKSAHLHRWNVDDVLELMKQAREECYEKKSDVRVSTP